jgi:hypothetical protein
MVDPSDQMFWARFIVYAAGASSGLVCIFESARHPPDLSGWSLAIVGWFLFAYCLVAFLRANSRTNA